MSVRKARFHSEQSLLKFLTAEQQYRVNILHQSQLYNASAIAREIGCPKYQVIDRISGRSKAGKPEILVGMARYLGAEVKFVSGVDVYEYDDESCAKAFAVLNQMRQSLTNDGNRNMTWAKLSMRAGYNVKWFMQRATGRARVDLHAVALLGHLLGISTFVELTHDFKKPNL